MEALEKPVEALGASMVGMTESIKNQDESSRRLEERSQRLEERFLMGMIIVGTIALASLLSSSLVLYKIVKDSSLSKSERALHSYVEVEATPPSKETALPKNQEYSNTSL